MKLIAQVQLLPTEEQAGALLNTLERVNEAANYVSARAWDCQVFGYYALRKLTYYEVRERFDLTAQATIQCIGKVAQAYKLDRKAQRTFKPHGAIAYDDRILTWKLSDQASSIWTVKGRERVPFIAGERQLELLKSRQGETDLVYRDEQFHLLATCNAEEPPTGKVDEFLGIDLGIKNIAADSDGETYSSGHLNSLRKRHRKLRKRLQKKGTKSALRLLKKRRCKESRMAKDVNHVIAKRIVEKATGTGRGIALENLKGIRKRTTVKKAKRSQHSSWSFADLQAKIEYKAGLRGVLVVAVDPRYTSQTCPVCGHVSKRNRPSQALFSCVLCMFSAHADTVAAMNIAVRGRAAVNQPHAATARG